MAYNRTYQISGEAGLDTTITPQADLISDIRSIEGITIVTFTPKNEEESAASNPNHVGILSLKFDTFPFTEFDKDTQINILVDQIRKMPAVNFFRASQVNILETRLKSLVKEMLLEKKTKRDRCLRIADRKFDKSSAYKSGAVVRCRQGKIWKGTK
jgi:DNA helicase HerA-like ATPase